MLVMNKWFELPLRTRSSDMAHSNAMGFRLQPSLRRNISWARHDVAGRPSAQNTGLQPQSREGKKNSQTILRRVNAFVGECLVPDVISHRSPCRSTALGNY